MLSGKLGIFRVLLYSFFILMCVVSLGYGLEFNDYSFRLPEDMLNDSSNAVVLSDVDGDGDLDIYECVSGQDRLLINDGSGVFTTTVGLLPDEGSDSRWAEFGDIDGDGDEDIFVANFDSSNAVFENNGKGVFSDVTSSWYSGGAMSSVTAAFGDIDGDGDDDLVVGNSVADKSSALKVYENTGSGFSDVTSSWISSQKASYVNKVLLSDVDGDGDLDLIVLCSLEKKNRLYINSGSSFTDKTSTNIPSAFNDRSTSSGVVGDVDGDGDLDLFVVNEGNGSSRLYTNDGSGVFTDVTDSKYPVDTNNSNDAVFGDIDGDGDLDIVVANGNTKVGSGGVEADRSKGENVIYLNDGSGGFSKASSSLFTDSKKNNSSGVAILSASGKPVNILFSNGNGDGLVLYSKEAAAFFSVSGKVVLSGGSSSVTDVEVKLTSDDESVISTTNPLSDGSYSFSHLTGGLGFTLTASLLGYEVSPSSIEVSRIVTDTVVEDFVLTYTVSGPAPKIIKFKPKKSKPNKVIEIIGRNFGSSEGKVIFKSKGHSGGIEGKVAKWGNKKIKVKVPFGADTGKVKVRTSDNQEVAKKFKVIKIKPSIKKVAKKLKAGKKVTVRGKNFGNTQFDGKLLIGGVSAEVLKWSNSKIIGMVPDFGKKSTKLVVKTHYGSASKKVKIR